MNPLKNMSTGRRLLFLLGSGTFVAGVVVLCFALLGGSDSSSGAPPRAEDVELRTHVPTFTQEPITEAPTLAATIPPTPPLEGQPYAMVIDKIGVNAPVGTYGLDEQLAPIVPTGDEAKSIVAWYDFSAKPGTGSNVVFAGHVTWFGPAVFYNLPSLAAGDTISLVGDDGTKVDYTVSDVYRVLADDPHAVEVMWPTSDPVITIITCIGEFTDTNDPVYGGEYQERLVVRGSLSSVTPGGAAAAAAGDGSGG
jgi:LPXTG-site transpeptidase (sortase) family protein